MRDTPETIAIFKEHEVRLDAEFEAALGLFSPLGIDIKLLCYREHEHSLPHMPIALEWGVLAERKWQAGGNLPFVSVHFVFLEPWEATDPLFISCKTQYGYVIDGKKNVTDSRRAGGSISLIYKVGLGSYIIERMREASVAVGQEL